MNLNTKKNEEKQPEKINNELDELVRAYYSIDETDIDKDLYYISLIGRIYAVFLTRTQLTLGKSKINEIKNNIYHSKDQEKIKRFNELSDEYKNIMNSAESEYEYYFSYLSSLDFKRKYKSENVAGIKEIYTKLSNLIINDRKKAYINLNKKIINLKDSFNNLITKK